MGRLIPILFTLSLGCFCGQEKQHQSKAGNIVDAIAEKEKSKIDYKANTYQLFLGQSKNSIEKVIYIKRDLEQDNSFNETDSIQHYMYIGEDLIKLTNPNTEVLPALYLTFEKNRLKNFECSILYTPELRNEKSIYTFIECLEPYFKKLSVDGNKDKLAKNLLFELDDLSAGEKFSIDTTGRQYDLLFKYQTEAK